MIKTDLKKVKKYATEAIKKVPKKKIINKAATYGLAQIIGGPYLTLLSLVFKKSKKHAITYAGSYAYESLLRSKFALEKLNIIPISLVSIMIRTVFNFLLFSRLVTGIHWLDFMISMIVTIFMTLLSPFFYSAVKNYEEVFTRHTNNVVNNFLGPNGWEYIDNIKNMIIFSLGILSLIVLQFVQINSRYLQEVIIHTLITGYVSDKILNFINNISLIKITYIGMFCTDEAQYMIPVMLPLREIKICDTKNRVFVELKSKRATLVKF